MASGGTTAAAPSPALPKTVRWLRECAAIVLWACAFLQLLVYDIGSYITTRMPAADWVFRFRLLVILATLSLLWLLLGNRRFVMFAGYIVAYPAVVLLWYVPLLFFKNWALLVAFSPAIHSVIKTFRSSFILFTIALIASFLVALSTNRWLVLIAVVILPIYLANHYIKRFRMAFLPSTVFAELGQSVRAAWESAKTNDAFKPPAAPASSKEDKTKFAANLLVTYIFTTALYVVANRLRAVAASRKLDMYFIGSLLYTFALTWIVFALEYFGIERWAPNSFSGIAAPQFRHFLGLSFSTLMSSGISPLRAVSTMAQSTQYSESLCSLLMFVLLVFIVLTSIRERFKEDLESVVRELRDASDQAGGLLEKNYELTMVSAELMLFEANRTVMKWLLELRHGPERAKELCSAMDVAIETKKVEVDKLPPADGSTV